jgi:hypothetical protein
MNFCRAPQMTLTLRGFLGQDVVLVHALALEPGTGLLEPLGGSTV